MALGERAASGWLDAAGGAAQFAEHTKYFPAHSEGACWRSHEWGGRE